MTEEEAKTKWCPFARSIMVAPSDAVQWPPCNRVFDGHTGEMGITGARCIASACMAWRKCEDGAYDKNGMLPGFCGLAGAPQ